MGRDGTGPSNLLYPVECHCCSFQYMNNIRCPKYIVDLTQPQHDPSLVPFQEGRLARERLRSEVCQQRPDQVGEVPGGGMRNIPNDTSERNGYSHGLLSHVSYHDNSAHQDHVYCTPCPLPIG